jgi:hypothetical protein
MNADSPSADPAARVGGIPVVVYRGIYLPAIRLAVELPAEIRLFVTVMFRHRSAMISPVTMAPINVQNPDTLISLSLPP